MGEKSTSNFEIDLLDHCLKILMKQKFQSHVHYVIAVKLAAMKSDRIDKKLEEFVKQMEYSDLSNEILLASINADETKIFLDKMSSLKVYDDSYYQFLTPLHLKVFY